MKTKNLILIEQRESDGYAYVVTTPSTEEEISNYRMFNDCTLGYEYKIITVDEAMTHPRLIGKEYLKQNV